MFIFQKNYPMKKVVLFIVAGLIGLTTYAQKELSGVTPTRTIKVGDKSLAFVLNSLSAARSNPEILPNSFDTDELDRDYALSRNLLEVLTVLNRLTEQVDDTLLAVGSEAMTSSLSVYDYVKTAAKREPGLKGLAEQLGERFKKVPRDRAVQEDGVAAKLHGGRCLGRGADARVH